MLTFKTISVPYDYRTGKLTYENTYYVEPPADKPNFRDIEFDPLPDYEFSPLPQETAASVEELEVPTNSEIASVPQPYSKKTVRLTTSNFRKDLGQSTIPFIDIQAVVTRPPMPLSGIGFYHKNREGYGGFLALKIKTYNQAPYVN